MNLIKNANELIKDKKVSEPIISEHSISCEVSKEYVRIFKKPGRTLISCSCANHARFCDEQPLCKHKLAMIFSLNKQT